MNTERKTSATGKIIIILVLIVAGLLYFTRDGGNGDSTRSSAPARSSTRNIVYKVTGSAGIHASLTYENESGGTEQRTVRLPWTYEFKANRSDFLYVSAQNQMDHGIIRCLITQNGETVQQAESTGAYVIASCSGSAK